MKFFKVWGILSLFMIGVAACGSSSSSEGQKTNGDDQNGLTKQDFVEKALDKEIHSMEIQIKGETSIQNGDQKSNQTMEVTLKSDNKVTHTIMNSANFHMEQYLTTNQCMSKHLMKEDG